MEAVIIVTKKKSVCNWFNSCFFCNIRFTENWGYVYLKIPASYLIMQTPFKCNMNLKHSIEAFMFNIEHEALRI